MQQALDDDDVARLGYCREPKKREEEAAVAVAGGGAGGGGGGEHGRGGGRSCGHQGLGLNGTPFYKKCKCKT